MENKLKLLELDIARTRELLTELEKQYGMNTAEFERRFDGVDLEETLDHLDWWGEIEMLRMLESEHNTLTGSST